MALSAVVCLIRGGCSVVAAVVKFQPSHSPISIHAADHGFFAQKTLIASSGDQYPSPRTPIDFGSSAAQAQLAQEYSGDSCDSSEKEGRDASDPDFVSTRRRRGKHSSVVGLRFMWIWSFVQTARDRLVCSQNQDRLLQ